MHDAQVATMALETNTASIDNLFERFARTPIRDSNESSSSINTPLDTGVREAAGALAGVEPSKHETDNGSCLVVSGMPVNREDGNGDTACKEWSRAERNITPTVAMTTIIPGNKIGARDMPADHSWDRKEQRLAAVCVLSELRVNTVLGVARDMESPGRGDGINSSDANEGSLCDDVGGREGAAVGGSPCAGNNDASRGVHVTPKEGRHEQGEAEERGNGEEGGSGLGGVFCEKGAEEGEREGNRGAAPASAAAKLSTKVFVNSNCDSGVGGDGSGSRVRGSSTNKRVRGSSGDDNRVDPDVQLVFARFMYTVP